MPRNVEIKARVVAAAAAALHRAAASLAGGGAGDAAGTEIRQQDTFFNASQGRLKLRQIQGAQAQLIFYSRPDQEGPKLSDYHITLIENPADLKKTLSLALGVKGEVTKLRTLYMVGQTRVHVDHVYELDGDFMELEVMLEDEQTAEDGQRIADDLMQKLGIEKDQLITGAYMDLILQKQGHKVNGN